MNCEPTGVPVESLDEGAVAPRSQFALLAVPLTVARWIVYDTLALEAGALKVTRTSSPALPLSKLPAAGTTLLGGSAPALVAMLNSLFPSGFGFESVCNALTAPAVGCS